jgi:hypothetical protein
MDAVRTENIIKGRLQFTEKKDRHFGGHFRLLISFQRS